MYNGNKVSRKVSLDEIPSILTNLITLKKSMGTAARKKNITTRFKVIQLLMHTKTKKKSLN